MFSLAYKECTMIKQYDTIELKIDNKLNDESAAWLGDFNRCAIVINGKDILEYITETQIKILNQKNRDDKPLDYCHLIPSELYEYLQEARLSNGTEKAMLVCCSCGIAECDSIEAHIVYTDNSVIWKDFNRIRCSDDYGLYFEFKKTQYQKFVDELRNTPDKNEVVLT